MLHPVQYCSFCGKPFAVPVATASELRQCEDCLALTICLPPATWQILKEESTSLPLAPSLGRSESFAECKSCGSELSVEVMLRSKAPACAPCSRLAESLNETAGPDFGLVFASTLRSAPLSAQEMEFLSLKMMPLAAPQTNE